MGEIGGGSGSSYPNSLDQDASQEQDDVTLAKAATVNDIAAAIIAVEQELGTNPKGTATSVKAFLIQEHDTDGTHGTLEDITLSGTVTFDGTGWPSFHVYAGSAQSINSGSITKIDFDKEDFDNGEYFSTENNNWNPDIGIVAKYCITAQATISSLSAGKWVQLHIFKNSIELKTALMYNDGSGARDVSVGISAILEGDRSGDDFDIRIEHNEGSALALDVTSTMTFFSGSRIA